MSLKLNISFDRLSLRDKKIYFNIEVASLHLVTYCLTKFRINY